MPSIDPRLKPFLIELDDLEREKLRLDDRMRAVYERAAAAGVSRGALKKLRRDRRQRRVFARRQPPNMPTPGEFME